MKLKEVIVGKNKGVVRFDKLTDDTVLLKFKSDIPAHLTDKQLGRIKSDGVEFSIQVPLEKVVEFYLKLKTFHESFRSMDDSIILLDGNKKIAIYRHQTKPYYLCIKGIDYETKRAGIVYIDTSNYVYVLFLSYLRTFLQNFPLLTYRLNPYISFVYNREDDLITVIDTDIDKFHYIEKDEINTAIELLSTFYETEQEMLFTHSFTPDRNVFIDKSGVFQINDKQFDLKAFKHFVYLISI